MENFKRYISVFCLSLLTGFSFADNLQLASANVSGSNSNFASSTVLPDPLAHTAIVTNIEIKRSISLGFPFVSGDESRRGLTFGLAGVSSSKNLTGINASLISIDSGDSAIGLNVAGIGLHVDNLLMGVNVSALAIGSEKDIVGLNIAGLIISANENLSGLTIAVQSARAGKKLSGLAIVPMHLRVGDEGSLVEGELAGVGISAINEINGKNNGVSIGIINKSWGGSGLQFGLVNYNRANPWWSKVLPFINSDFSRFKKPTQVAMTK